MDHALRRRRLAALLPEAGVDALWVTRLSNVRYLTGFTGSNGQVLIAGDRARLFTDG
ncbi:MAG: aminopeptidase P family N-terminal domain-containing protein, partial [Actinomycetota bacterium]